MPILTSQEKEFLDVFIHEATTEPFFRGPATQALRGIGVAYTDIANICWAYDLECPRTVEGWGHAAEASPPLPWPDRETALHRNQEIEKIRKEKRQAASSR